MRKNSILIVYGVGLVALVVFAFFDLQISILLSNNTQVFSLIMEYIGELPLVFMAGVSSIAMIMTADIKNKVLKVLHHIAFGLVYLLSLMFGSFLISNYMGFGNMGLPITALVLIAITVGIVLLIKKTDKKQLRKIAKLGVTLFFAVVLTFNLMKFAWGRERFRHMMGDYSGFSPWYLPQSFTSDNEFMSFPSGHAANAATILWFTLLPFLKKNKIFMGFSVLWILAVMYSRVVLGAHFASDVTFGALITISWFLILKKSYKIKVN